MYLEHFQLKQFPFALSPNTEFFCHLKGHQEALNVLLYGINAGEGFIKVIGEVGTGKTILCRKILKTLDNSFVTAYIPNPDLNPLELRKAFAQELGINVSAQIDRCDLLNLISNKLLSLAALGKKVILIIDEAQALPDKSLETLRLLTNLETESEKLLQVILFAQPEFDERLKSCHFRQLNQRVTFSYRLKPIRKDDLHSYLCYRLAVAGCTRGSLFDKKACNLLYHASKGLPRIINILSHKALLACYGFGDQIVGRKAMLRAISDSRDIIGHDSVTLRRRLIWFSFLIGVASLGVASYYVGYFIKF